MRAYTAVRWALAQEPHFVYVLLFYTSEVSLKGLSTVTHWQCSTCAVRSTGVCSSFFIILVLLRFVCAHEFLLSLLLQNNLTPNQCLPSVILCCLTGGARNGMQCQMPTTSNWIWICCSRSRLCISKRTRRELKECTLRCGGFELFFPCFHRDTSQNAYKKVSARWEGSCNCSHLRNASGRCCLHHRSRS